MSRVPCPCSLCVLMHSFISHGDERKYGWRMLIKIEAAVHVTRTTVSQTIGEALSVKMVREVRAGPESRAQTGFWTVAATVDECELKERRMCGWTKSWVVSAILGPFAAHSIWRISSREMRRFRPTLINYKRHIFCLIFGLAHYVRRNEQCYLEPFYFIWYVFPMKPTCWSSWVAQ